ncbi:hypothetical protein [Flavonifractor plautii]|uniref:hypothetical protein n=1 Tax=Flavonifractor plautii TaxID=292800 RepID=UPI00214AAF1B|nr:hypothetical protein [Flavonifractor plautii]MCR1923294.1 hypothetical protein [Flavonifractor plautii]
MIIEKLILREGMVENLDTFSEKRNLIYSKSNTKGKSTYVRLLFYALGYPIPNMRGIKYEEIITEITFSEKGQTYTAIRENNLIILFFNNSRIEFTLPSQHLSFLSFIFKYENIKVLKNLLGFMYIDQDKGWTLLNRGTVIGKIKFSIEELLAGLNGIDIDELIEKKSSLELNKEKYLAMLNMQELSEQVYEQNGEIFISNIEKELNEKIAYCNIKLENENSALKEINSVLLKEKQFFDYIDSMNLSVKQGDIVIPVNRSTLLNSTANYEYLRAHRSIIVTNIEKLKRERSSYQAKLNEYYVKNSQISILSNEDKDTLINKQLANFNIDQKVVRQLLEETKKDLKYVTAEIKRTIKNQNTYISKIYKYVLEYATELHVDDKMAAKEDFIFTSDLKSLSGAVLQKMVFAFKVAFLKVIEESMNTKLFIVLDSPKGKELDDDNMKLIENLISTELCDNQIFFASIYDLEHEKLIEIKNRAIEGRNN